MFFDGLACQLYLNRALYTQANVFSNGAKKDTHKRKKTQTIGVLTYAPALRFNVLKDY